MSNINGLMVPLEPERDQVNHPSHYKSGGMEVIDVIEAFGIDRKSGHAQNVLKYLLRAGEKGELLVDLRKAQWYLNRLVKRVEQNDGTW